MRLLQHEAEKYSGKFSECARALCAALLAKSAAARLGCGAGKRGAAQVKQHRFFSQLTWARLEAGMVDAPFVPDVSSATILISKSLDFYIFIFIFYRC